MRVMQEIVHQIKLNPKPAAIAEPKLEPVNLTVIGVHGVLVPARESALLVQPRPAV